ncbi:hypothetical protein CRM22_001342 [Opisthorchis felineus]|uniref:Glutathione synthetase n=2 Tax=Opisthorchis felineus TaxID=147828 RepID=A0A4S2MB15_OPIFE|nr:hypothetical protein CRM22_001342 [Opisthorchis felineus]
MEHLDEITLLAGRFAQLNGILKKNGDLISPLSCTLLPSPFPLQSLEFARSIQQDFNLLFHKVAGSHSFLESLMKHIIEHDDYMQHLWDIYNRVRQQDRMQDIFLGLNRSDYMLHQDPDMDPRLKESIDERLRRTYQSAQFHANTHYDWQGLVLRQVEFNLMASSFCGMSQRIVQQHRQCLSLCGFSEESLIRVPECNAADNFADAMATAVQLYLKECGQSSSGSSSVAAVMMIVSSAESNAYDQAALFASLVSRHPHIPVMIRTFEDLHATTGRLKLDDDLRLFVDGRHVGVVYFRFGYIPDHFPNEETWDVKYQLERSMAIKCPCIQYMLANTKLVQAALSKPSELAKFIDPSKPSYSHILSTFAKQFTLTDSFGLFDQEEVDQVIKNCLSDPHLYVLKPQREGGGNNYFDDELVTKLNSLLEQGDHFSYIIMERLFPFIVENFILTSPDPTKRHEMVSELGIFGAFIGRGDTVLLNEQSGHLLRTKLLQSNEGGIAAGYGCLDSPFLV